jgi:hypothetical protein
VIYEQSATSTLAVRKSTKEKKKKENWKTLRVFSVSDGFTHLVTNTPTRLESGNLATCKDRSLTPPSKS